MSYVRMVRPFKWPTVKSPPIFQVEHHKFLVSREALYHSDGNEVLLDTFNDASSR